jgi:multidrug efflux pump
VDRVIDLLPELRASISPAIDTTVAVDRSTTIRASLREVDRTLLISIVLVILVVFVFLRNVRATLAACNRPMQLPVPSRGPGKHR